MLRAPGFLGGLGLDLDPFGAQLQSCPLGLAHDLASIGLHFLMKFARKAKQSIPTDPSEEGVGVVSFFLRKTCAVTRLTVYRVLFRWQRHNTKEIKSKH